MYIANRRLIATDSSGNDLNVEIGIGVPYETADGSWACPVCMRGLQDNLKDIVGIDSWQALQLAYQLIADLLHYFVEDGGSLRSVEDSQPVQISDLIPNPKS